MNHDHNFKNLILDYPREALRFFAADEAEHIDDSARIVPIRQEQLRRQVEIILSTPRACLGHQCKARFAGNGRSLAKKRNTAVMAQVRPNVNIILTCLLKERLGERFRELDTPLLVEWPDQRRELLLFVLEEESEPSRFNIHRLAHYCLDLAELFDTERIVPVVIFLKPGDYPTDLHLGGDRHRYLSFHYLHCSLSQLAYEHYKDSDNLVARLNLSNMAYPEKQKIDVYAESVRGLLELEANPDKRLKYMDYIDMYASLTDNEQIIYQQRYPKESAEMGSTFTERMSKPFIDQGMQQGMQQGEQLLITRQLTRKFGRIPEEKLKMIREADEETLLTWSDRILTANSIDEVLH